MSISNFKIIKHEKRYILKVNYEVGIWNIWDFEHDTNVHDYLDTHILFENETSATLIQSSKIPFIPFIRNRMLISVHRIDEYTTRSISYSPLSAISIATMRAEPIDDHQTEFTMNYQIILFSYLKLLTPLFRIMIKVWTEKTWKEDLPLKLRRHKMIMRKFKDYRGITKDKKKQNISLPLPKLKSSKVFNLLKKIENDDF